VSQNGQFPGGGEQHGLQPGQQPGNFGNQPGGSWQGQPGQYPPAGQPQQPAAGPPQQPGWGKQPSGPGLPPQQPGQGWPQGQQPGMPQQPGEGWSQQQPGQGWQQPGQQPPADWNQGPAAFGQQPPFGPGPQPPYGAGGPPPQGPGQQPWGYPPQPGQGGEPRKSNRALIGIVAGVVGVALVGGAVYAVQNWNSSNPTPRQTVSLPGSSQLPQPSVPQPTVPVAKPSDVVDSYLRALANADAKTVLSLGAGTITGDTSLLTDAVLARSTAPQLTTIAVPEVTDPNATSVAATYALAGRPVSATFEVTNVGGQFRMVQVAAPVDISRLQRPLVPIKLAGVRPSGSASTVYLFPGIYPVTAANAYYSYGSAKVTVSDLDEQTPGTGKVSISSAGKAAIVRAVSAKYKWCLKQNSLKPTGCALWVRQPSGVTIRKSTIAYRTQSGAKWRSAKPKFVGAGVVEAAAKARVRFDARSTDGRRWFANGLKVTGYRALIGSSKVTASFY